MMNANYSEFQAHLGRVRRAWKRTAVLQGLAAITIEGIGMFLLFILVDYVYSLPQYIRITSVAVIAACLTLLLVRHVIRPLLRKISDDQIALYIEERQQESDGALLSAATFGMNASGTQSPVYSFIIENIVQSAVRKAGGIQLSKVLNLSRLRKYTVVAAIALLLVGLSAVRYAHFFGRHANRLLMPWEMTEEDLRSSGTLVESEPKTTFEILFGENGNRILRGSTLNVKTKLSRAASNDVLIRFRSAVGTDFNSLKMNDVDELNTFAARLPDINDDFEFFIQSGKYVSDSVRISVYDAIELKSFEIALTPPAYTQWETKVEKGTSADISALAGTSVKLRALANVPLSEGELRFDDGHVLPLKIDEAGKASVIGGFNIDKSGSFSVKLIAADHQTLESSATYAVKMLPDGPPTVTLTTPGSDMEVHASTEVVFAAKVGDDVGVRSATLVCNFPGGSEDLTDFPFKLEGQPAPGEREVSLVLPLADIGRDLKAGDSIFYHVRVTDTKGQQTLSDLFVLQLRAYEVAIALPKKGGHAPDHEPFANLIQFIAATWNIHTQREHLGKADFGRRCEDVADKIQHVDRPHLLEGVPKNPSPEVKRALDQAWESVKRGIEDLQSHDTQKALTDLRSALTTLKKYTVKQDSIAGTLNGMKYADFAADPMQAALGNLSISPPPIPEDDPPFFSHPIKPDFIRQVSAQKAKEAQETAKKLKQRQHEIVTEAKRLALNDHGGAGEDETHAPAGEPKPAAANQPDAAQKPPENAQKNAAQAAGAAHDTPNNERKDTLAGRDEQVAELRKKQDELAKDVRRLSAQLAQGAPAADKNTNEAVDEIRKAAEAMQDAADQMKGGDMQRAAARGEQAAAGLNKAVEKLDVVQYKFLEDAVEAAEDRAAHIAETQKKIREATDKVAAEAHDRMAQANGGKPGTGAEQKLNPREQQKMKGLANWQAENEKSAENVEEFINDLAKWAAAGKTDDATEGLKKAARMLKQDAATEAMVNAAVNLGMMEVDEAREAQNKAEKTMSKVVKSLQDINGALAQSREQKLKRAIGDAKEILAKAEQLAGRGQDKDAGKGEAKPGSQQNAGTDDVAEAAGQNAAGDHPKPGADQAGAEKIGDGKDKSPAQANAKSDNKTGKDAVPDKRQTQDELYHETVRLMHRLEKDKLVDGTIQAPVKGLLEREKDFTDLFKDGQTAQLDVYLNSLRAVSSNLEVSLQSILKGKRLSGAQREQTPNEYRQMVNSYYERLAKE